MLEPDVPLDVERALARAREEAAHFRTLFEQHPDATFSLDRAGRVVDANPACAILFGFPREEIAGRTLPSLVDAEHEREVASHVLAVLGGAEREWTSDVVHPSGRRGCAEFTLVPLHAEGAVVGAHGIARDVTIRRVMEEQLTHQAFHDALTGLANRLLFHDRVDRALRRMSHGRHAAVLFIDLDDFKVINDSLGHGAGDALLRAVAERLLRATRGCDTVARLGGDEFAILLEEMAAPGDAEPVLSRVLTTLRVPVYLGGRAVVTTASVGLAHADDATTADELLRNADVAMYDAKRAGKARHAEFHPAMHRAAMNRLELESDLRDAGARGELRLVYQPVVALASGQVLALEALVRWHHPTRGLVSPAEFIPLAEETGLILEVGRWVLREALDQLARWDRELPGSALAVAVNVSGRQIEHATLVDDVRAALAASGIDPARLTLEITETAVMQAPERVLDRLHALRALGVKLAIDDFGTGYSSLGYLRHFPVDVLKIDRTFVDGVARGGSDTAIARTIIALGEALRLRIVAEGVELGEQREALDALGCGFGQGYLFSRPLPPERLAEWHSRGAA